MKRRVAALVAAVGFLGGGVGAPAQEARLLVLSKLEHTLAVVDPKTLKVLVKAPAGEDPHEVAASADGRTAFVSNYGFGAFHSITMIDVATGKRTATVDTGALAGPHGLYTQGGKTWFTAEGAKVVARLDPKTRTIDLVVGTGENRTHMVHVSEDGRHIIATNVASGTLSLIDEVPVESQEPGSPPDAKGLPPRVAWNQTVLKTGKGGEGFDVTPDGRQIWVANAGDGTVSMIDWPQKKNLGTLDVGAKKGNRLKFTLDGKLALISAGAELVAVDTATHAVVKRLTLGKGSGGILMEPGGKRAFVACGPDNYVAVIDLASMTVVGRLEVGGNPDGMAFGGL